MFVRIDFTSDITISYVISSKLKFSSTTPDEQLHPGNNVSMVTQAFYTSVYMFLISFKIT